MQHPVAQTLQQQMPGHRLQQGQVPGHPLQQQVPRPMQQQQQRTAPTVQQQCLQLVPLAEAKTYHLQIHEVETTDEDEETSSVRALSGLSGFEQRRMPSPPERDEEQRNRMELWKFDRNKLSEYNNPPIDAGDMRRAFQ